MRTIKMYVFLSILMFESVTIFFIYGVDYLESNKDKDISGAYKLSNLQAQDSQEFKPMEDVEILKIFVDGIWISPAYEKSTKKVVSLSGGRYTYNSNKNSVVEEVLFNMKDLSSIGLKTTYKLYLTDKGFYQSGIYKKGTQDAWKVEENWLFLEKNLNDLKLLMQYKNSENFKLSQAHNKN